MAKSCKIAHKLPITKVKGHFNNVRSMDYFIFGSSAIRLHREARRNNGIRLVASDITRIPRAASGRAFSTDGFSIPEIAVLCPESTRSPIDLLVPKASDRIRANGVRCSVRSGELPTGSYLQLEFDDSVFHRGAGLANINQNRYYVDSPELTVVTMAGHLAHRVHAGRISNQMAFVSLFELCAEMCGTYARHPMLPRSGECAFWTKPIASSEAIRSTIESLSHMDGLALAKKVAPWIFDNSASPMETLHFGAVSLAPRFGGLSIDRPKMNTPLFPTEQQRRLMRHQTLRPDLSWPELKVAIEHNGREWHDFAGKRDDDDARIQDYQLCGWKVFPVRYRDVRNQTQFNKFALRLCKSLEEASGKNVMRRVTALMRDDDFLQRQAALLSMLLPPVMHYGE